MPRRGAIPGFNLRFTDGGYPSSLMKREKRLKWVGSMAAMLAASAIMGLSAQAADWPEWRGANRDGKSPDTRISREWPAGGPALLWTSSGLGAGYASVSLAGDHIYGHSEGAGWICQDLMTGETVWREKEATDKGSCVFAGGMLVLREENKGNSDVVLIDASPKGYVERGRFRQPNQSGLNSWPHPVIVDGRLYLRDQDLLLCYDVEG